MNYRTNVYQLMERLCIINRDPVANEEEIDKLEQALLTAGELFYEGRPDLQYDCPVTGEFVELEVREGYRQLKTTRNILRVTHTIEDA